MCLHCLRHMFAFFFLKLLKYNTSYYIQEYIVRFLGSPVQGQELESVILVGPSQLRISYDSLQLLTARSDSHFHLLTHTPLPGALLPEKYLLKILP